MIRFFVLIWCLLLFSACSTTTPKNAWQIQSANAYESHQKYFLQDEDALARTDLKRAIKYAKQSSDMDTLATIYLSECALHVSILEEDKCKDYMEIEPLISDVKLHSYYLFLQNNYSTEEIKNLPYKYQNFAALRLKNDFNAAQKEILNTEDILSKMIMASLIKNSLDSSTIKMLIDEASLYGYKKNILNWMQFYETKITDEKEKTILKEKLKILKDSK